MASGEKVGGFETKKLTPRAQRVLDATVAYQKGWSEGEAQARPENIRMAERILQTMDLGVLKDIFIEYLRKSGVPEENANTAALEPILTRPSKGADAFYTASINAIALSTTSQDIQEAIQLSAAGQELDPTLLRTIQLVLVHEMTHAFSRNRVSSRDLPNARTEITSESGYGESQETHRVPMRPEKESRRDTVMHDRFVGFNEGVTQRIAEEVYMEYARRTGFDGEAAEHLEAAHKKRTESLWRYQIFMNQVGAMCERIAAYVGVPEETVWDSIKRGYFEKSPLYEEETVELLRETFGDSIFAFSSFNNQTPAGEIGRFDAKHDFPPPEEFAPKWLKHLGIEYKADR